LIERFEQRLSVALKASALPTVTAPVEFARGAMLPDEAGEAVGARAVLTAAPEATGSSLFGDDVPWPTDEGAEASFLPDARERGETEVPLAAVAAEPSAKEESEAELGALPPLDELVQRIPAEVRDALEELYRVKFTAVRRVPAQALRK
jgi:hypothetical protein